ncbi:MAG TPA: hypothetical protein VHC70_05445 [Phycisphaerales bacterium]|nr:hypothetical protein [Phycisphaerales bacterium]
MSGLILVSTPAANCSADVGIRGLGFLNASDPTGVTGISADGHTVLGISGIVGNQTPLFWSIDPSIQLHQITRPQGWTDVTPISISANGSTVLVIRTNTLSPSAYLYTSGVVTLIPNPAGTSSIHAVALSPDGSFFVGSASFSGGVGTRAVRWNSPTSATQLALPGSTIQATAAVAASDGSIYGAGYNGATGYSVLAQWHDNLVTPLATLPISGTVAAAPRFVSADGTVILGETDTNSSSPTSTAWLWSAASGFQPIPLPNGSNSFIPSGMSADASIVVGRNDIFSSTPSALIWTPQLGTRTFANFLTLAGVNVGGWTFDDPPVVSADGTRFAGDGLDPNGRREAYLVTIPAPACAPALLCGLALLPRPRRRVSAHSPSNSARA